MTKRSFTTPFPKTMRQGFFMLCFCFWAGVALSGQSYGEKGWRFDSEKYDARFPDMWHWAQAGVQCGIPAVGELEVVDTVDASANLQKVIDKVAEQGGGVILMQEGIYPLNETLYLKDHVVLRGINRAEVVLSNQLRGPFFKSPFDNVSGVKFEQVNWAGLENLTLDYQAVDFDPLDYAYFDYPWQKKTFKNDPEGDYQLYVTHITFDQARNAWIKNCQVLDAGTDPILVLESEHISITKTRVDGAYNKGGRGNGYLNIEQNSKYVLIAEDTVRAIRHFALQSGAKYNVVINNYFEVDVNFHNGDAGHNLIQGNTIRVPEWHSWHCFSRGLANHHLPPGPGNILFNNYTQYKTRIPGKRDRITEYGDSIIYKAIVPADTVEAWGKPQVVHDYGWPDYEKMSHQGKLYIMNDAWDKRKSVLPLEMDAPKANTLYPVSLNLSDSDCN